jgi:HEAT repeat protein
LLFTQLIEGNADGRRQAARALSREPDAAPVLASRLEFESEAQVRDALFASLVEIGGMEVVGLVAVLLRSADAGLRGGAVEALKQLGADVVPALDALLCDRDPDVRLLVVEVTRAWPSALAIPRLKRVFETDPHVNVCGAAVDVATELGTIELLPALSELKQRFPEQLFLTFAVDIACSRILAADRRNT